MDYRGKQIKEWQILFNRCEACREPFEFHDKDTKIKINKFYFCVDCAKDSLEYFIEYTKVTIKDKQEEIRRKHCIYCPHVFPFPYFKCKYFEKDKA